MRIGCSCFSFWFVFKTVYVSQPSPMVARHAKLLSAMFFFIVTLSMYAATTTTSFDEGFRFVLLLFLSSIW